MRSESILQKSKRCWVCHSVYALERHHVMHGTALRKMSEKYGLTVWLCAEHHRGNAGVHGRNHALDIALRKYAQRKFEERYSHHEWMRIFGRNYLDEKDAGRGSEEAKRAHINGCRIQLSDSDSFADDPAVPGWDCEGVSDHERGREKAAGGVG